MRFIAVTLLVRWWLPRATRIGSPEWCALHNWLLVHGDLPDDKSRPTMKLLEQRLDALPRAYFAAQDEYYRTLRDYAVRVIPFLVGLFSSIIYLNWS